MLAIQDNRQEFRSSGLNHLGFIDYQVLMPEFFDPHGELDTHGVKLPHWQQRAVTQFVTFRLKDALPQSKQKEWRELRAAWLHHHPKPWSHHVANEYHREFTSKIEGWLDQGMGACLLSDKRCRSKLEEVLMYDHPRRAEFHAWVIMPNHVHLLFTPCKSLSLLMKSWKGISARRIDRGSIWQKNYHDRLIRNEAHYYRVIMYIRRNPIGLKPNTFTLWESEEVRAIE